MNRAAKEIIAGYRLVREARFPGHIPIGIKFKGELEVADCYEMRKSNKIERPGEWMKESTDKEKQEILGRLITQHKEEFGKARKQKR